MDLHKIGRFIASLRKEVGLTQEKLGEVLGVTDNAVSKWERGINAPDIAMLKPLAKILGVTVVEILNGCRTTDKNEIDPIKSIEYYSNVARNKYLKLFTYITLGIVTFFSIMFTINNYNRFKVYSVHSKNEDFIVEGYMVYNQDKNLTIIRNIDLHDTAIGTKNEEQILSIKVSMKSEDKNLFSIFQESVEEEQNISSFLLNKTYFINEDLSAKEYILSEDIKLNKLSLEINYVDVQSKEKVINIPLKITKEYSSNKLFY